MLSRGRQIVIAALVLAGGCEVQVGEHDNPTSETSNQAATSSYVAVADSRLREAYPDVNYGTHFMLLVDKEPGASVESYFKFDLSGLSGTVSGAKLRIFCASDTVDPLHVYATDTAWEETEITWANRPAHRTLVAKVPAPTTREQWYEWDVTSAIKGPGKYSFAVVGSGPDSLWMKSREDPNQPQLVVKYSGGGSGDDTTDDTTDHTSDDTSSGDTDNPFVKYWPPYVSSSFWNMPIPSNPPIRSDSAALLSRISARGVLTSDVTQNSYPIYFIDDSTPTSSVEVKNYFSYFEDFDVNPDGVRRGAGWNPTIANVPIPADPASGGGIDAQILFWNPITGDEWTFWQFYVTSSGYVSTNGYLYNAKLGTGRMVKSGRGAGVSKMGGLVAAYEVEVLGRVRHAVAFSTPRPSSEWVWPATKSDGIGTPGVDIPEGARIQLNPRLTDADFDRMGLSSEAKIIAKALQTYGMILVDASGRPKAFLESEKTGAWPNPGALEYALAPLTRDASGATNWGLHWRVIDWNDWTGGPRGILGR